MKGKYAGVIDVHLKRKLWISNGDEMDMTIDDPFIIDPERLRALNANLKEYRKEKKMFNWFT